MSIIGFVESVSVAQVFAAKRRENIQTNSELAGLGFANVLAFFAAAMPVSGGFSRSVVNNDAGVETPVAAIFTGIGISLVLLFMVPVIQHVPVAVLAATILVAVLSLADLKVLKNTLTYSKVDFTAAAATMFITLLEGVEMGVGVGVAISVLMHLYRVSKPHVAIVGLVPGTEHFRNINRHDVLTSPEILSVRIDESLYFANAKFLEETIREVLLKYPKTKHFVLICSAINFIDSSALESLESINSRLKDIGITFHLSELKGPVTDRLARSDFLQQLSGKVFLSHYLAICELDPKLVQQAESGPPDTQPPDMPLAVGIAN
jgi:SulP family sulfate permease